jgi:hypothetical protein
MKRSTGALLFSLASVVATALVWTGVLPWAGSIGALVLSFIGSFLGFVSVGDSKARGDNFVAWAGAIIGSLVMIVGCWLFLVPLLASPTAANR